MYKWIILTLTLVGFVTTLEYKSSQYLRGPAQNNSHHLVVGSRMPGDKLVLKENIVKNSSWLQNVMVTKTFYAPQWTKLTQVAAYDNKTNGNGAFASLLKGGPGHSNVTLKFKSQRGHGINFIVELYARG